MVRTMRCVAFGLALGLLTAPLCSGQNEAGVGTALQGQNIADYVRMRVDRYRPEAPVWYILAGCPQTVFAELARRGYATKGDDSGSLCGRGPADFQEEDLSELYAHCRRYEQYEKDALNSQQDIVFFDCGPVESISSLLVRSQTPPEGMLLFVESGLLEGRYSHKVFLFKDFGPSTQTEGEVDDVELMRRYEQDYHALGFDVVVVPRGAVETQADFILSHVKEVPLAPAIITMPSGLSYCVLRPANENGHSPVKGGLAFIYFMGWIADAEGRPLLSKKIMSSFDYIIAGRGGCCVPTLLRVGVGDIPIAGCDEGLLAMKAGEKRRLIIPPHLAYGEKGDGSAVPPNATLVIDIELLAAAQQEFA